MHLDDALLEETNGSRILRDLADRALAATGLPEDDPTLLAPVASLEALTGHSPSADIRRFCTALCGQTLSDGRFSIQLPDPGANAWEALISGPGGTDEVAATLCLVLHRALPVGALDRPDGAVALGLLLEDLWGFKAGRVLASGGALGSDLARVDKRLGTFLYHLAQDQGQDHSRSATEAWPRWQTQASWIAGVIAGGSLPDNMGEDAFLRLIPEMDEATTAEALLAGPADRIQLLWRSFILGEDALLALALPACAAGATRLEQDAAALVEQLKAGRDAVGPWVGIVAQRADAAARVAAARRAGRSGDPAPEPARDPPASQPGPAQGEASTKPFRPAGSAIPGPPLGGWPTHASSFRPVVHPWARWAVVLTLIALPVLFFSALCSGC